MKKMINRLPYIFFLWIVFGAFAWFMELKYATGGFIVGMFSGQDIYRKYPGQPKMYLAMVILGLLGGLIQMLYNDFIPRQPLINTLFYAAALGVFFVFVVTAVDLLWDMFFKNKDVIDKSEPEQEA